MLIASANDKELKHKKLTIAIVAGEHSGDHYGAMLMAKLKEQYSNCEFIGVGGSQMQAAGLCSLMPMEILSVIGIVNVIKKLPSLIKAKNKLVKDILSFKPDCFIGIDAPDFNLRLAKSLKKLAGKHNLVIKTVQYVSPTIWAWRAGRIKTVAKATDLVLCIFPFEAKIYQQANIKAQFVGHPLADKLRVRTVLARENNKYKILQCINSAHAALNVLSNKKIIGLFPGSRVGELNSLATVFIKTALLLMQKNTDFYFVVPIANEKLNAIWLKSYQEFLSINQIELPIIVIKTYECNNNINISSTDIMQACDLILCASGTTTLEALLLNIPMVVAYKISKLNELLIRLLIKVRYVAMPNILADKLFGNYIVPEFLQTDVTAENLAPAILQELNKYCNNMTNNQWQEIQDYLRADNINHEQAVVTSISTLINNN